MAYPLRQFAIIKIAIWLLYRASLEHANKQNAIIAMTIAILCNNRHPSMQKIISLTLQAGWFAKQVRKTCKQYKVIIILN